MKDGRTHLAHKLEHAVDMSSGAVVAVTVQEATQGDSQTVVKTVDEARHTLASLAKGDRHSTDHLQELVLDRGYHSNATMTFLRREGIRSYAAEPDRGRRRWEGKREAQTATDANRRRSKGKRGKALQRKHVASFWNGPSRTVWRPEHCVASIYATVRTSSNAC